MTVSRVPIRRLTVFYTQAFPRRNMGRRYQLGVPFKMDLHVGAERLSASALEDLDQSFDLSWIQTESNKLAGLSVVVSDLDLRVTRIDPPVRSFWASTLSPPDDMERTLVDVIVCDYDGCNLFVWHLAISLLPISGVCVM